MEFRGEYAFLSNFHYSEIILENLVFPTLEHAYQFLKTNDPYFRTEMLKAANPGVAKRIGRRAPLRKDWEESKVHLMFSLLTYKFRAGSELFTKLHNTGDRWLAEGNYWGDKFWGIDIKTGEGRNELGRLLMLVRAHNRDVQGPQLI